MIPKNKTPRNLAESVCAELRKRHAVVPDEEIIAGIAALGRVGIFAEPAGATAYAGLLKGLREGLVTPDDPILVLNTGSGLKDIKAAMSAVKDAPVIKPTLAAVRQLLSA